MKIAATLAKLPWNRVLRFLPGVIGIAGEIAARRTELAQADSLKRLEELQHNLEQDVEVLLSRLKVVFWIAAAALAIAVAALVLVLAR
jgi:hypothetical protein